MRQVAAVALALVLAASRAAADEIKLTNGRTITGIYSTDPGKPGKVIIEIGAGVIELDAKEVSNYTRGRTALQEYHEKWEAVRGSNHVEDLWNLAQWARKNGLHKFVGPLCEQVIGLAPDHEGARKELRYERVGEKWLTRDEAQAAKGLVQWEGRWVTKAEKELIEKRRLEAKERALLARQEREMQRAEELCRRQQRIEECMDWWERQSRLPYGYLYQPNWFWPAYYRPYPWLPYMYKRPPSYGGLCDRYGGIPTFNIFDFVVNPFRK